MSGTRGRLLIVEDSRETAELLSNVLEEAGFEPLLCSTATAGEEAFRQAAPVAVLVDWVLPDRPGVELVRQIREFDPVIPVILVSGRDDEASVARGLDAGADDFVVKPFRSAELVARLEANLRKAAAVKAHRPEAAGANGDRWRAFGAVEIDPAARMVRVDGQEVGLGPLEFKLLEYFARHAGIAISREQVLQQVYGYDAEISTERVDLLVRRLRAKLGDGPDRGGQLVAVPGFGYRLERRLGREAD